MVAMTSEVPSPGSRHSRTAAAPDLSTLSAAVNSTYDHLDELTDAILRHYRRTAPSSGEVPQPTTADGTVHPPHVPDAAWILRAALTAAEGIIPATPGAADFDAEHTGFLADLGRDLRKDGITMDHYAAATEAASRALCDIHGVPFPGTGLSYREARKVGLPDGLNELLQLIDQGIRIAALGAVDDDEAGIHPAVAARVLEIQQRSPRVTVVRLQATPPQTGWAGQFLEVRTPEDSGPETGRTPGPWWSVASAIPPNPGGLVEFALFHPAGAVPAVTVGEHWVLANPTGALEIPDSTPVTMIALDSGLSPLRALILDVSDRPDPPPVHLYWQVDHRDDLHEYTGLLGLAAAFDWLTVTPVVTDEAGRGIGNGTAENSWARYCRPSPEQLIHGEPLRHGTAAAVAVADDAVRGRRILVAGDPRDPRTTVSVRDTVSVLTAAGADPRLLVAEPR